MQEGQRYRERRREFALPPLLSPQGQFTLSHSLSYSHKPKNMNGHTRNASIESVEEKQAAQEWLHNNGDNVAGIEQKLEYEKNASSPERNLYVTRKLRRRDDGPVETICAWVVRHQIGMF